MAGATSSAILTPDVEEETSGVNLVSLQVSDATISAFLRSYGDTFLGNTIIAGDFSVDGTLSVTGNSINTIGTSPDGGPQGLLGGGTGILYLQNSPLASLVDFFNGLVTIDQKGNLIAQTITTNKLIITNGQENPAPTIGSSIIPTGQVEIPVFTSTVTDKSKIFITLLTSSSGQAPYVSSIVEGSGFVVTLDTPLTTDIKFNWLIIDNK